MKGAALLRNPLLFFKLIFNMKKKRLVANTSFNHKVLDAMSDKEIKKWWAAQNFDMSLSDWLDSRKHGPGSGQLAADFDQVRTPPES